MPTCKNKLKNLKTTKSVKTDNNFQSVKLKKNLQNKIPFNSNSTVNV